MKLLKSILLLIVVSTLSAGAQGHIVKAKLKKIAEDFNTLPDAKKKEYVKYKEKAFKAREQEKYLTCLVAINDAQAIFEKDMDLLFLNGICRAQLHDVDNAIKYYEKVLAIDPTHIFTLMNIIEINYFSGRYKEAIKYMELVNDIVNSRANGQKLPLLDFKYLIALTKLSKKEPAKYQPLMDKVRDKYGFMDDHPFYYYSNALQAFDDGDKQEGLIWILKAYLIFETPAMIEVWNKALIDTDYIGAYEIMFNTQEEK